MKIVKDGADGKLIILEAGKDVPFKVKRVYFIENLRKRSLRGLHAHKKLHQAIFPLKGRFRLSCYDGKTIEEYWLKKPGDITFLPPLCWHMMDRFSKGCIICVLASGHYDENDYIRDFTEFKRRTK